MSNLLAVAPDDGVTEYDRRQLALYAALLDADASGTNWQDAATNVMQLDPSEKGAKRCWQSHLERARWIVGEGLVQAVEAFGRHDVGGPR
jgi:hypothetical protein